MQKFKVIEIKDGVTRHPDYRFRTPVNFELWSDEQLAIVGRNGAGKSMLVDIITGKHPLLLNQVKYAFPKGAENIKYVAFRDSYGTADATYYYQQRWNQHDIDEAPLCSALLDEAYEAAESILQKDTYISDEEKNTISQQRQQLRTMLYEVFQLQPLLDKQIILLSSGELRKFQLTKALITNPRLLILDNPFVGLDSTARDLLNEVLVKITDELGVQIILVLAKSDGMPDYITHVVTVDDMTVMPKQTISEWRKAQTDVPAKVLPQNLEQAILDLPQNPDCEWLQTVDAPVIDFRKVSIRYGERTILKDLSFTVENGEHWALSGRNGSGKSTLLSIVCADNPQSYANDIVLFGYQRGTGESIWEIKKHIGYISPEMHRSFQKPLPAIDIVASGLLDSIGLYHRPKPEQRQICEFWMDVFGVGQYANTNFLVLSSGEQRLVLLARAFVKDPSLLILDEPLHGLDLMNRRRVKDIIETFCRRKGKTLLMVTHYEEDLPSIIDKRICLKREA